MPLLWRYLIKQFLKVFLLTVASLVLCLLTLRIEDIAHFISLDTSRSFTLWFVLYQIPYILPVAIPLSCLIASMILIQRLSYHHEISALRALGYSVRSVFTPLLLVGFLISLLNFFITSEIATSTHLKTNRLKSELLSINPLLVLNNKHLMRVKGFYFDALGATKTGELASDVVVALPGKKGARMNLFLAKKLEAKGDEFSGSHLTFISTLEDKEKVIVENIGRTYSENSDFSHLVQKKVWSLNDDYLGFKFLLFRWQELQSDDTGDLKKLARTQSRLVAEIARRFSLGFAPFTFTLMGLSFGLSISRGQDRKRLIWVTTLAALFLTTFFFAKGIDHKLTASLLLYGIPHVLIISASLYQMRKINLGISA